MAELTETLGLLKPAGDERVNVATQVSGNFEIIDKALRGGVAIEKFGAVGDDATDDSDAFEEAIASGRKIILTPGKTYYTSYLNLSNTENLTLSGYGAAIRCPNQATSDDTLMLVFGCENVILEGFELYTNAAAGEINGAYGVGVDESTGIRVRDVKVHDVAATGIVFSNSTRLGASGCEVFDTQADGIRFATSCESFTAFANHVHDTGDDGMSVVSAISDGARCKGFSIFGNTVEDTTLGRGIAIVGGENGAVVGNTIRDTDLSGIWIAEDSSFSTFSSRNVTVSGNNLFNVNTTNDSSHGGIGVAGGSNTSDRQLTNISIHGNLVNTCNGPPIRFAGASTAAIKDVFVTGNYASNVNGSNAQGIRASNTTNLFINGNMVVGANAHGIYIVSSCDGQIRIHNNVLLDLNRSGTGGVDGIHVEAVPSTASVSIVDYVVTGTNLDKAVETAAANTGIRELFPTTTTITGDYTIDRYDGERTLLVNSGSAVVISIPTDAVTPLRVGTRVFVNRIGAGSVTVSAVTPGTTTVVSKGAAPAAPTINGQYGRVVIQKTAANAWIVTDDVA